MLPFIRTEGTLGSRRRRQRGSRPYEDRRVASALFSLLISTHHDRILHIPSFEREYGLYWDESNSNSHVFVLKLVLVLSIGASLQSNSELKLRSSVRQWIYGAQSWFSSPFEKSRLNMNGLQIFCLLLIARQVNAVESDLVSLSHLIASFAPIVSGTDHQCYNDRYLSLSSRSALT